MVKRTLMQKALFFEGAGAYQETFVLLENPK